MPSSDPEPQTRERGVPDQGRALDTIDRVTFEIVRHRLWCIQGELATTIKAMSGSPIASEAGDFNTSLMDADGNGVLIGAYIAMQGLTQSRVVRAVLDDYGRDFVRPGDMFLCNDPWKGALHQNDVACVAPVFVDHDLIAWVGSVIHQLDVGGPVPGGFGLGVRSVYEEPLPTPPMRIVEGGAIRPDLEAVYLRRSRLPTFMRLDLRAQIGANNVAHKRIEETCAAYGPEVVRDTLSGIIEMVELKVRARLRDLPDMRVEEVALLDHDGVDRDSVYAIVAEIEVRGEHLVCDFSKSSPQAPALINCARPALEGAVVAAVLASLCYDLPWSPGGVERCLTVQSQPGSVCDVTFPGGASGASIFASRAALMATMNAMSRVLQKGGHDPHRVSSGWPGSSDNAQIMGATQDGEPFVITFLETGRGAPAFSFRDGLDTGGILDSIATSNANVETNELLSPVVYLFRRESPDTGGPGKWRGGVGTSYAVQVRNATGVLRTWGQGFACPIVSGLDGGQTAPYALNVVVRGESDVVAEHYGPVRDAVAEVFRDHDDPPPLNKPTELVALDADCALTIERLEAKHVINVAHGDIYAIRGVGGAGFGAPAARDSSDVRRDVEQGYVSVERARRDYEQRVLIDERGCAVPDLDASDQVARREEPGGSTEIVESWVTVEGRTVELVRTRLAGAVVDERLMLGSSRA